MQSDKSRSIWPVTSAKVINKRLKENWITFFLEIYNVTAIVAVFNAPMRSSLPTMSPCPETIEIGRL